MASAKQLAFYLSDISIVLVLALLFLCLCFYLSFVWKKREMFIKSWNVPGPFNFPVIGATYHFMTHPKYIFGRFLKLQERYPEGFKLWFGNRLMYSIQEPDHIEKILGSNRFLQKDYLYQHVAYGVGEGLLTAPVEKWKKHRKFIMPTFNQKILDSFVEVFAEQSLVLAEILAETCGTTPDIFKINSRNTLDSVCETIMGLKLNIQRGNSDYELVFDKIMLLGNIRIFQIWNHIDFIWKLLGYEKRWVEYQKKFNNLMDLVIKQKMEAIEAKKYGTSSTLSFEEAPRKRLAFLDYIMECGEFSTLELRDEITILLFAGTDTTASTLAFLFAVLGMFPDVQQKVLEEVIQVLGNDRLPDFKDLSHMAYTERVIKETMRLFPVACSFARLCTEDVDMGDFVVPNGTAAYFGTVFIHRNPKYWPDPLKFDPDRFLPQEVAKRHPCTYIPFSFGPRNCLGLKYGMMNMKVVVATVIRKLKIHCDYKKIEDIKLSANIVLRFQDDAKVSFAPREQ